MKIIENVYLVPQVVANPYLLVNDDELTLIDAGLPGSEKKILAYVASLGKSPSDLKRIILTHSDLDHVGGLAALVKATGARTYASQIEAQAIAAGKPSRQIDRSGFSFRRLLMGLLRPFFKTTPFQVDEVLADGQVLPVLGGLRVVTTPGHTPGHISLYAPAEPAVTWDAAQARDSVRAQAGLGARIVCSGHGPAVKDAAGKFPLE